MKKIGTILLLFMLVLGTTLQIVTATEDITTDPMTFALNNTTVDLSHADANNSDATKVTLQNSHYFEYTVNTATEQAYLLTFTCGTKGSTGMPSMDVSVNGTLVLDNAELEDTGSWSTRKPHELGVITLTPGANVIRFQAVGGSVVATQFSLSKKRSAYIIPVNATLSAAGVAAEGSITVSEAGMYGVTATTTAAENSVIRVSADDSVVARTVNGAGESYIGSIYLEAGEQIVKIAATEGTAAVTSVTLDEVQNDLTDAVTAIDIDIDKETVDTTITEGETALAMTEGQSFTVKVSAAKAFNYALSMTCSGTGKFTVKVNGYNQLNKSDASSLGIVSLNRGENTLIFTLSEGAVTVDKLSLALTDSFQNDSYTVWSQENRVPNYYTVTTTPVGFIKSQGGSPCFAMRPTCWLEYDIYTTQERTVNLILDAAMASAGAFSVAVNGQTQIDNEQTPAISEANNKYDTYQLNGLLRIPAGHSVVRVTQNTNVAAMCFMRSMTFAVCTEDRVFLENFDLVTKEGARLPYVVKDGFTAYAKVDVVKSGNPTEKYLLMLAQYAEDTSLVGISVEEIDVSLMADKEKKTVTAPLTYQGSGGWVKAFLVNKETMAPQENAIMYQDTMYFNKDILEEPVAYTDATNVLNGAGEHYGDYSIHNDKYDIDAIFYDSVVGNQSKVFAYIGVPKGATEDNPVPAVVCVHGGSGVAFPEWVKLWNDKGFAAIAMTLTGDGPDVPSTPSEAASAVGQYPHPYMGVTCWGPNAFLADVESAAMYQNVLNVIRAHNVLRSCPGVDETKTGITGISWGGVTTTTVIGVDDRFRFAVPVYGTGYLDESETYFSSYFTPTANTVEWDPANFAARSSVPTLYINSNSDVHFSINSTTKTAGVTENSKISIHHQLAHGYGTGWGRPEIYAFAEAMVNGGSDPFITISEEKAENGTLTAKIAYPTGVSLASVTTYYITEEALPYYDSKDDINWESIETYTQTADGVSVSLPSDATFCYASLMDNNGNIISTKFIPVA